MAPITRSLRSGEPILLSSRSELYGLMQIIVRDNNVDQALRALKKKLQREGVYRGNEAPPSLRSPARSAPVGDAAAVRHARRLERKRVEHDSPAR